MKDLFSLAGRKAIVTGAAAGLGRGMAEALHEAGAELCLVDLSPRTAAVAAEIAAAGGPRAGAVVADLSRRGEAERAFAEAHAFLGGLDVLVNDAGTQARHPSEDFPLEDWDRVIEVNLTATFRLCQLAGRVMLAQGRGKIVNVASMLSFFGGLTVPAYAASKGGVAQLTKTLSNEWAPRGVCVNAIAPGWMATALTTALQGNPQREPEILARVPMHRWGTPDDLKGAVVFLASPASDYVSGIVLPVDGGYLAR
jgi:2-deoxy-D-gluconate 3-dehydrogenase